MADSSPESKGILFIYDLDGKDWINYWIEILTGPEYSIPCTSVLWSHLSEDLTSCHPVHILFLTPKMEYHIYDIEHSILNYSSETSLLLECNVDSSRLDMINWAVKQKLEDDIESQRFLLSTIVQLYETAVNDAVYEHVVPDVNIIPSTIFPGQEEVYIIFSKDPNSEIIVKLAGERLRTRKCSDRIYACDLPIISCGQKNISVYKKDSSYPISTTRVAVVTVKALLQNLIDNMESALGVSSNIMEIDEETIDKRLTTVFEIGFNFNPFHKASDDTLKTFAKQIHQMYNKSLQGEEKRDSGFAQECKYHDTFMPMEDLELSLPEIPARIRGEHQRMNRRASGEHQRVYRAASGEHQRMNRRASDESHCVADRIGDAKFRRGSLPDSEGKLKRKDKLFKMFGMKRSSADKSKNSENRGKSRMSKRMVNASQQFITDMPQLPVKSNRRI